MIHKLTPLEKAIADYFSRQRNKKEKQFGAMTYSVNTGINAHYVGICGEIAAAQLLGGEIDFSTYARGDNGVDLVIDGVKVDVKTTTYSVDPWLRVETEHWHPETCYVLCSFDQQKDTVELIGRCRGSTIKRIGEVKKLTKNGPTNYILKQSMLPKFKRDSITLTAEIIQRA